MEEFYPLFIFIPKKKKGLRPKKRDGAGGIFLLHPKIIHEDGHLFFPVCLVVVAPYLA